MNLNKIGWIAAALLVGGLVTAGFQTPVNKTGVVDMEKVFNESTFAKSQTENLRNMGAARQAVLEFVNTYRTVTVENATKFRDLTFKKELNATEKADLERIKNEGQAGETKYRELITKTAPTAAELKQIDDLNKRKDASGDLIQTWQQEFTKEIQDKQTTLRTEALQKVRAAIQKVAKDQGYSVVFDASMVPYCANDITDEALKAVNK